MCVRKLVKLFTLALSISVISACSQPKTEQEVLDHVATLAPAEAEIYLKNYLSKSQLATAVRIKLAEAMVKQGDYENALAQYDKVEQDLSSIQIAYKVEALYMTSSFDRVLALLEKGPFNAKEVSNTAFVHALLQQQINNNPEFLISLNKTALAAKSAPSLSSVVALTADFASHLDQTKYVTQMRELIESSDNLQSNWLVINILGTTAFSVKEYDTSVMAFDWYTTLRPKYLKIQLLQATALVYAKRHAEAKPILNKMLQVSPEQALANQLYAYVAIQELDYEKAKLSMEKAIQNGYGSHQNFLFAAEVNYRLKNYEQTVSFLEKAFANRAITEKYYNMLIYSKSVTGTIDGAISSVESASVDQATHIETLGALSSGLQDVGNTASLSQLLDKLTASPDLTPTSSLDLALIAKGNNLPKYTQLGIDASEKVLNGYLNNEAAIEPRLINSAKSIIVANLVAQQQYDVAIQRLLEWDARKPARFNHLLLAETYNVQGDYAKTIELLEGRLSSFNNAAVYNALGSAYVNASNATKAHEVLEQGLTRFPFNLDLLRQYSNHFKASSLGSTQFITQLFNNKQLEDAIALSIFYGINQQPDEALKALLKVPKEQQSNVLYLHSLAEVYIDGNDSESATSTISQVMRLQKLSVDEIKYALSTLRTLKNVDLQIELLEKYAPDFPSNNELKMLLASAYLANNDTKSADKTLNTFELESAQYWSLKAKTALNLSKFDDANRFYSRAFSRYPSEKTVVEYAQFLKLTGNHEKALSVLNAYVAENVNALNPLLLLATMQTGQVSIDNYQRVLAINPNNVVALNNIAELYLEQGAYKTALPYAEKASELMPNNATIESTLTAIKQAM